MKQTCIYKVLVRTLAVLLGTLSLSTSCAQSQCAAADLSCNPIARLLYQSFTDPDCLVRGQVPTEGWAGFVGEAVEDDQVNSVCGLPDGRIAFASAIGANETSVQGQLPVRGYAGGDLDFNTAVYLMDEFGRLDRFTYFGQAATTFTQPFVATAPDGSIYLAAIVGANIPVLDGVSPLQSFGGGGSDIVLLRLTSDLQVVWYRYIGGAGDEQLGGLEIAGDGSLLIAGQANADHAFDGLTPRNAYAGGVDATVYRVSADGQGLWYMFLGTTGNDLRARVDRFNLERRGGAQSDASDRFAVALSAFGDIPALLGRTPERAYTGSNDILVLQIDRSGALERYGFYGGSAAQNLVRLVALRDGSIFALANTAEDLPTLDGVARLGDGLSGAGDALLLWLNADGSVRNFRLFGAATSETFTAVTEANNGDLWISGSITTSVFDALSPFAHRGSSDVGLLRINPAGEILQFTLYGGPTADIVNAMSPTADGGVIIAGDADSTGFTFPEATNLFDPYSGSTVDGYYLRVFANGRTVQ